MLRLIAILTVSLSTGTAGLSLGDTPGPELDHRHCSTLALEGGNGNGGVISMQLLNPLLKLCCDTWGYSYGELRSAYNHGNLTIEKHDKNGDQAYDVTYEGNFICVLENTL